MAVITECATTFSLTTLSLLTQQNIFAVSLSVAMLNVVAPLISALFYIVFHILPLKKLPQILNHARNWKKMAYLHWQNTE
jgi:hypothetical protein